MHILRRALVEAGGYDPIETVHGLGYRLLRPRPERSKRAPHAEARSAAAHRRRRSRRCASRSSARSAITLYMASEDMEDGLVEQIVAEEMESLDAALRTTGTPPPPSGPNLQYYVLRTPADYEKLPPQLRALAPGHHEVGTAPTRTRRGARRRRRALHRRVRRRRRTSCASSASSAWSCSRSRRGAGRRGSSATGSPACSRGSSPSSRGRVAQLAPDERHPPLERADHDREVAALAHALDEYHARIVEMIAARAGIHREREPRAAHAAHRDPHELRAARGGAGAERERRAPRST